MNFKEYQKQAGKTNQFTGTSEKAVSISLLGFIGEMGSLVTIFKKRLRDKQAYTYFKENMKEEMGDILWYMTNLATKYDLSLDEIAQDNINKIKTMWANSNIPLPRHELYDEKFSSEEKLPRRFNAKFEEIQTGNGLRKVKITINGKPFGDVLNDNAYEDDGYRYHDAFHFAYAAILGWSPVARKMLNAKRKSDSEIDQIEDGARAGITDEAISLYVYNYAKNHSLLEGTNHVDSEVLRTIRNLASGYEVRNRSYHDWRMAILKGYEVFRMLNKHNGGEIIVDLVERKIEFKEK